MNTYDDLPITSGEISIATLDYVKSPEGMLDLPFNFCSMGCGSGSRFSRFWIKLSDSVR